METETKHTPTPWTWIVSNNGRKLVHVETAHDNPHGAGLPVCSIPVARESDAAFIVRAVNAYDELMGLLIHFQEWAEGLAERPDSEIVKAAIRRAEEVR